MMGVLVIFEADRLAHNGDKVTSADFRFLEDMVLILVIL